MRLEAVARRAVGVKLQQARCDPRLQIDADGAHVANELLRRLFEQKAQAAFAAPARRVEEMRREAGLPSAGRAGDEHRAPAEVTLAAEHRVDAGQSGGDTVERRAVLERHRGHGQHADAVGIDQERILVGAVVRAAILHDAQPARRHLIVDAVIEQNHGIRHVLLEPLSRQQALAALARNHGGDALILQPAKQPSQLRPQDRVVLEAGKQRLDRVEDDAFGADRSNRVVEPNEETFEVVFARFFDLGTLHADVIDGKFP